MPPRPHACPDCDDPLIFAFSDASGLGAQKRGDGYNTVPDTDHYLCVPCRNAWKQRLDGPLTPDVVGELAFFTCADADCGGRLDVTRESADPAGPAGMELSCAKGHRYGVTTLDGGELKLRRMQ